MWGACKGMLCVELLFKFESMSNVYRQPASFGGCHLLVVVEDRQSVGCTCEQPRLAADFGYCNGCRNWASGARFSWCVAGFRTTPIPNKDPVGYLKVPAASIKMIYLACTIKGVPCTVVLGVVGCMHTASCMHAEARATVCIAGPAGDCPRREGPPVCAGLHRPVQVQACMCACAYLFRACNVVQSITVPCQQHTKQEPADSLDTAENAKMSQASQANMVCPN